jgi:hypothetical protein
MPCQHVLAPVTGTGLSQAAETAATARASPGWGQRGKLPAGMSWDLPHMLSRMVINLGRQSSSFRALPIRHSCARRPS